MKLKYILLVTTLYFTYLVSAQTNINAYKYVTIPKQYNFLKSEDKYQVNSLTKFLFDKEGFTTLYNDEQLPEELYANPCLGLKANVISDSGMFSTKLIIVLTDCRNREVFKSAEGKSKQKEFKKSYHQALRKAFESVKALDYIFDKQLTVNKQSEPAKVVKSETVKPTAEKIKTTDKTNVKLETSQNQIKAKSNVALVENTNQHVLYAQKIFNGFQLVDSTPKIVFVALQSSTKELYFLKNVTGILYKESDKWFAEYYKDDVLVKEELNIKF